MRVFATGATGFFGKYLLDALQADGHGVVALVRSGEEAGRMNARGVETAEGDVGRDLSGAIAGAKPDAVIHLVGIIREPRGATFEQVHVEGTRNVVEAAKKAGVRRYLHMSALGTWANAVSRYHKTKYAAERIVVDSGIDYTIFRPSVMFGPGDEFINQLKNFYANPLFVPVIGSGGVKLQPVFAGDVARMFSLALTTEGARNRVFEVGGEKSYTFNELLDVVGNHLGKKRFKVHVPIPLMRMAAAIFEKTMKMPKVTRDQLIMLAEDNVCDPGPALKAFGMKTMSLEEKIREYI